MTAPRIFSELPRVEFVESITQWSSGVPLPVKECTAPATVDTLPPSWTKTGRPLGAL